ncbi:MAG TPA: vitamin K epoxide reductase family protein [Pseudobdellovibrionaceae bacterium]|nr:vitamin K epoxide reductase family protein [Pseudobdellovibrionaceae bacterium]
MKITRERSLLLAIVFTLLAVGIHAYLARQHYALKYGGLTGPSVCNVSSTFSCDAVAASSYSAAFGIPVAVFGAVANLMLIFFLGITRLGWTDDRESTGRYALWLAALIAAAALVMGAISFTQMSAYCLFCIACYVLSFVTLFFTWKGTDGFVHVKDDFIALFSSRYWVLICALLIPGIAFLVNASTVKSSGLADIERYLGEFVGQWQAAPLQTFAADKGLVFQKSAREPSLTIVEFADFRCSHCRHAAPTLHAFAESRPDVKLILKFYPLDGTCNPSPLLGGRGDGISCQLAFLAQCEQKLRGQGWEAHNYFFEHQDQIIGISSVKELNDRYCKDRPGNCEELIACTESQSTRDEIRALAQEGIDAQVQGTPAIFGNGKLIRNGQILPVLDAVHRATSKNR